MIELPGSERAHICLALIAPWWIATSGRDVISGPETRGKYLAPRSEIAVHLTLALIIAQVQATLNRYTRSRVRVPRKHSRQLVCFAK